MRIPSAPGLATQRTSAPLCFRAFHVSLGIYLHLPRTNPAPYARRVHENENETISDLLLPISFSMLPFSRCHLCALSLYVGHLVVGFLLLE